MRDVEKDPTPYSDQWKQDQHSHNYYIFEFFPVVEAYCTVVVVPVHLLAEWAGFTLLTVISLATHDMQKKIWKAWTPYMIDHISKKQSRSLLYVLEVSWVANKIIMREITHTQMCMCHINNTSLQQSGKNLSIKVPYINVNCMMMMLVYIDLGDEEFISNIPITVLILQYIY